MSLRDQLPDIYRQILPAQILDQSPEECLATCSNCAEVHPGGRYQPELKCCTFFPFVPNYLLGAILLGPSNEGQNRLLKMFKRREFLLPLGLCASPDYQQRFNKHGEQSFGQRSDLLCPFYRSGQCSIWSHRPSECATFICRSSYGALGLKYWQQLNETLYGLEIRLAEEAMLYKGFSGREVKANLEMIRQDSHLGSEARLSTDLRGQFWQHHRGRELEYYKACYQFVAELGEQGLKANILQDEPEYFVPAIQAFEAML